MNTDVVTVSNRNLNVSYIPILDIDQCLTRQHAMTRSIGHRFKDIHSTFLLRPCFFNNSKSNFDHILVRFYLNLHLVASNF